MVLILAFGSHLDPQAWDLTDTLKEYISDAQFVKTDNPQDILNTRGDLVILDVVKGIEKATLLSINDLKKKDIFTVHDFDLGFFLKLMKDSGIIDDMKIIGIPERWDRKTVEDVKEILLQGNE